MKCEYLFCDDDAAAKLTVPHHKPQCPLCEEHLKEMLKWAEPFRRAPGLVVVAR